MTENRAVEMLRQGDKYADEVDFTYEEYCEALNMAIQALEEIQELREGIKATSDRLWSAMKICDAYREIGTIDECAEMQVQYNYLSSKIKKYESIGTVEEFKALKEKATPYKPKEYEDKYYGCKCGEVLLEKWEEYPKKLMSKSWGLPYCLGCGQALDWSE